MKQQKKYILVSIGLHVFVILVLLFFPWSSKKDEVVNSIQMVNADAMLPPGGTIQSPKAAEPITPITAPKKDEILISEKPVLKPKPKPAKPAPRIQSKLKDKLKDLLKDEPEKPATDSSSSEDDLKKNSPLNQEPVAAQAEVQSSSTNTPGL